MNDLLAFTLGVTHPSARMRIAAYAEAMLRLGWRWRLHPFDPDMGKCEPPVRYPWDRIVRHCQQGWRGLRASEALSRLPPEIPILISRELPVPARPFLQAAQPLVLDIDDALYLGPGREQILQICRQARLVVCGNETIAADLTPFARACHIIPTVVDTDRYQVRADYRTVGPPRIGWLGSSMSINETLAPLLPVLTDLCHRLPFKLVVIADEMPPDMHARDWIHFVPWSPAVENTLAAYLDIGIMPLVDSPFQRAKCGAKLLQYMAAGLPVIASPVGINRRLVADGHNGFHAVTPADWRLAIERLARREDLRRAFGRAGRDWVVQHYSVSRWAPVWAELLNGLNLPAYRAG